MKSSGTAIILVFILLTGLPSRSQTDSSLKVSAETKRWFNQEAWLGGWKVKPHETINQTEFAAQYRLNKGYWDKAFQFLKTTDLKKLAPGRYPIDGENVYVLVSENPTKDPDSAQWESHRSYTDLHYVVSGKEFIGHTDIKKLTVSGPYDSSTDLIHYTGNGELFPAEPHSFFIFFPADAHRPGITPGGNKKDKKIVIKIRYSYYD